MIKIDYNVLLKYISGQKNGRIEQFKNYINNLDYNDEIEKLEHKPYSQIIQMFSRLGHIEVDYKKNRFSVCPATLVVLPNKKEGILAGSRTDSFIESLKGRRDIKIDFKENYNAPDCIKVNFDNYDDAADLQDILERNNIEIKISENFCQNVLNIVPSINKIKANWQPTTEPPNFEYLEQFRLYKFKRHGFNDYYIKQDNQWYKVDYNYGKFITCQNKKLLKYDGNDQILYLDKFFRFPELIDRALTMCSGMNPTDAILKIKDKKNCIHQLECLKYLNIDKQTAKKVAAILNQKIGE